MNTKSQTTLRARRDRGGFTLVEIIVYVAVFSMFSMFIVNMLMQTIKSFSAFRASREMNDAAIYAMERMTREIRNADSINAAQSVFGADPGWITLNTLSASGTATTVEYLSATSTLRLRVNGVDQGALTPSKTKVTELIFTTATSTASTTAIRIQLRLESQRSAIKISNYFYDTVVLRGTY